MKSLSTSVVKKWTRDKVTRATENSGGARGKRSFTIGNLGRLEKTMSYGGGRSIPSKKELKKAAHVGKPAIGFGLTSGVRVRKSCGEETRERQVRGEQARVSFVIMGENALRVQARKRRQWRGGRGRGGRGEAETPGEGESGLG